MKFVTVGIFENAPQAHAARSLLEAAGIQAVLADEELVSQLWHVGAFNGVKLQVAANDEQRARQTLEQDVELPPREGAAEWRCTKCREVIEADFEVCWSCGALREEAADPEFVPHAGTTPPASVEQFAENETAPTEPASFDPNNPYAPSHVRDAPPDMDELPTASEAVEERVIRAWRAAVIGIGLCPGALHLYSICLLFSAAVAGQKLSAAGKFRFVAALLIDLVVLGVGATFFVALQRS